MLINKDKSEFDIRIKDNFLNQEDFNKIKSYSKNIHWQPMGVCYDPTTPTHVWFTDNAPKEITDIMEKEVSKFFKIKILNIKLNQFSLVSKSKKVEAHTDISEITNFQTILYIDGDETVHSGTGFYIKKSKNNFELNTHIGFRPNRIVSWTSNVWHAPLSFTDTFKPRTSLITQYKIRK